MNRPTDGELIAKAKQGEDWALEEFLESHRRDLLYYLWGETCDKVAADELYNDTLMEFYQDFMNIKKNESARSYLFRIAYRNFLDWHKKEDRRAGIAEIIPILNEDEAEKYYGICEDEI